VAKYCWPLRSGIETSIAWKGPRFGRGAAVVVAAAAVVVAVVVAVVEGLWPDRLCE